VECKDGAHHEMFEVDGPLVLQAREVLDRPVGANIRITPVSSTVEAIFGVIFPEDVNSLIAPRHCLLANREVVDEGLAQSFFRILDCFDVCNVAMHLFFQVPQS